MSIKNGEFSVNVTLVSRSVIILAFLALLEAERVRSIRACWLFTNHKGDLIYDDKSISKIEQRTDPLDLLFQKIIYSHILLCLKIYY